MYNLYLIGVIYLVSIDFVKIVLCLKKLRNVDHFSDQVSPGAPEGPKGRGRISEGHFLS